MICPDSHANFLYFFDVSVAPPLLFYSYIPIIIATVLFGVIVFRKGQHSLGSKLILCISLSFCLWVLNVLAQWIGVYVSGVHLAWQLTAIFEVSIYLFTLYFYIVFLKGNDLTLKAKVFLIILFLPVMVFLPTRWNVSSFDLANCEGVLGSLWIYIYMMEVSIIGFILFFGFTSLRRNLSKRRPETLLLTCGVVVFLTAFFLSNFYGELTGVYEFNLWGPLGMVMFLALLSYMIVRFKTFSVKLFGAQVLIASLTVLISSQFFFIRSNINRVLTGVTLAVFIGFGIVLVRSVRREIESREKIEKQEKELEKVNERLKELDQLKSEFVSLATHQIRGPLTSIKGYASMVLEGDYGDLPRPFKGPLDTIYQSSKSLAVIVDDFLNVSRIEQGRMKYDLTTFDLCRLINEVANEIRPTIENKGLKLSVTTCSDAVNISGDYGKLKQVILNLLDNSSKYTQKGSITVSLVPNRDEKKVLFMIKDTGVGIRASTIPHLFQKFSRAEDASKVNILGTGLGLYVAKEMIKAHGGKIWVESEGEGKGATFFVELKLV